MQKSNAFNLPGAQNLSDGKNRRTVSKDKAAGIVALKFASGFFQRS